MNERRIHLVPVEGEQQIEDALVHARQYLTDTAVSSAVIVIVDSATYETLRTENWP